MIQIHDKTFIPFIKRDQIEGRIRELGIQISQDYQGKNPLFIVVLKGSFMFATDLIKACNLVSEIGFVRFKSYEGMNSTGEVKTIMDLDQDIKGRNIIIVEDIVTTGHTLNMYLSKLKSHKPASIKIASLLFKPDRLLHDIKVDYCGFVIEDKFVIGYGLDYDELGRSLPEVYILSDQKVTIN
jgi:hypoxanthine phosphoribosyltransferase